MSSNKQKQQWLNETNTMGIMVDQGQIVQSGPVHYPIAEESEQAVLSAILVAGARGQGASAFRRVGQLKYQDFFRSYHGYIFRAMELLVNRGDEIDIITLADELAKHTYRDKSLLDYLPNRRHYLTKLSFGS